MVRDRCKEVVLGVNYGIGPDTMAAKMGATAAEARELLARHKQTYRDFWDWSRRTVDCAVLIGWMETTFGWRRRITSTDRAPSLMNWPMQANGAEMMRIGAIAATEAGIEVCAPIHDAYLIAAPLHRLENDVEHMRELMSKAGEVVTGGLSVRTDAMIIRAPDRYMDERGIEMWNLVVDLLHMPEARFEKTV
jgi:DNA polymerase I